MCTLQVYKNLYFNKISTLAKNANDHRKKIQNPPQIFEKYNKVEKSMEQAKMT